MKKAFSPTIPVSERRLPTSNLIGLLDPSGSSPRQVSQTPGLTLLEVWPKTSRGPFPTSITLQPSDPKIVNLHQYLWLTIHRHQADPALSWIHQCSLILHKLKAVILLIYFPPKSNSDLCFAPLSRADIKLPHQGFLGRWNFTFLEFLPFRHSKEIFER